MVFLNQYLNKIRDYITSTVDYGELGTGTDSPSESDTDLTTPDTTTKKQLIQVTKSDKSIKFDYNLNSTEGTTGTYSEFGLFDNTDSLLATKTIFTGIEFEKDGTKDIQITTIMFLRNV